MCHDYTHNRFSRVGIVSVQKTIDDAIVGQLYIHFVYMVLMSWYSISIAYWGSHFQCFQITTVLEREFCFTKTIFLHVKNYKQKKNY